MALQTIEHQRTVWALGLLEANGGGVKKQYFRDKCLALGHLSYSGFYGFVAMLRGKDWIKEIEHKDGHVWIMMTESGLEQLQALRSATP